VFFESIYVFRTYKRKSSGGAMEMEYLVNAAIVTAISIETRSMSLYSAMSTKVQGLRTRRLLELLAHEEADHLESFCSLYGGTAEQFTNIQTTNSIYTDPYYCSLLESVTGGSTEEEVLQIALKEEQSCIEWYSAFVDSIREPHLQALFIRILNETQKHADLISEEYMRLMRMVDRSDHDIFVRE
jgi:rubrerythrin